MITRNKIRNCLAALWLGIVLWVGWASGPAYGQHSFSCASNGTGCDLGATCYLGNEDCALQGFSFCQEDVCCFGYTDICESSCPLPGNVCFD